MAKNITIKVPGKHLHTLYEQDFKKRHQLKCHPRYCFVEIFSAVPATHF